MAPKFTSKEIPFLKTKQSETCQVCAPQTYLSDLLHSPTVRFTAFEDRLRQTLDAKDRFIAAVVCVDAKAPARVKEEVPQVFETSLTALLDKQRGMWENLDPLTYALVFWDYDTQKEGIRLLTLLKDKLAGQLKTGLIMGLAVYPFKDFTWDKILGNALKALDHAAFFDPGQAICFDSTSLNISGDRLYHLEKFEAAISEYEQGLSICPKDINLINSLGVAYGVTAQLDEALHCFEQAADVRADEVMVVYNIGLIHRIKGDEKKALLYLKKAHAIDPKIFEVELLLGYLLFNGDAHDSAIPHLDAAARLKPSSSAPFRIKGQILLHKKDAAGAGAAFNAAVKLNPGDATALSGYAQAMASQKKNLGIALSFAEKSVAMEPENDLFSARLAKIKELHDKSCASTCKTQIKSA